MEKLERHINLIALLLNTRRPLSAAEIREKIPGYEGQSGDTFHRMFERDKSDIRELGMTLEQEEAIDGEPGYRISRQEALLEDPGLEPDEMAALSLAAQSWGAGEVGTLGVLKLSVGAGPSGPGPTGWLLPRVSVGGDIAALMDAVHHRKVVRFRYKTASGETLDREVEPRRLSHRGDWYLTGYDRARGAVRHFKLGRVEGKIAVNTGAKPDFDVPEGTDAGIPHGPWEGDEIALEARVAFAPETAWLVERRTRATRTRERDDGWVEVLMPCADVHSFAGWVAGFADAAVVMEPTALRDAVIAHLRAAGGD